MRMPTIEELLEVGRGGHCAAERHQREEKGAHSSGRIRGSLSSLKQAKERFDGATRVILIRVYYTG
jgi:hypothetical protein